MSADSGCPIVCTDLDFTLVDHTEAPHFSSLRALQDQLKAREVFLIYNSGRSVDNVVKELVNGPASLRIPDVIIGQVGTEVVHGEGLCPDLEWEAHLDATGWDRERLLEAVLRIVPEIERQGEEGNGKHKLSFYSEAETANALRAGLELEGFGQDTVSVIHSHGRYLDVVPAASGKGNALRFVLGKLAAKRGVAPTDLARQTLCCGDSGNDCLMLEVEGVQGCVVGNADADLLAWLSAQDAEARGRIIHYAGQRGPMAIASALGRLGVAGE